VVTARGTDAGPRGVLRRIAAVALVAVALAGCASKDDGQPAASGGGSTVPGRLLVDYRRTGGLIGRTEHLVVNSDGGAVLEGTGPRHDARLDAATMRKLVATLDRANLPKLRARYAPPVRGNDLVTHVITYHGRTVTVTDTVVPAPLRPVLIELNQVVIEVRGA
jgi:hypothetical protein